MSIGTIIKKLRRDKDMTQEKLAEYLNISTQAVSRWETDLAMPDITLLPALANIFNVTTDYLLGVDITKKRERITEYGNAAKIPYEKGESKTVISIWRKALLEFPNDFEVMYQLASALHFFGNFHDDKAYYDEALSLCEKIYNECTDDKIRNNAVQLLVYLYDGKGEKDKAKQIAENMPGIYTCSESLLSHILVGNELLEHERNNLDIHLDFMRWNIIRISRNEIYSTEEKIQLHLTFEKIFDIIFEDDLEEMKKGYGYYINIAELYASLEDVENTFLYIDKAKFSAIEYDKDPAYTHKYNMKSIIFKGRVREIFYSKNYNFNESMNVLKQLNEHKCYDFIRDDQHFKDIVTELEQYAKYE